MWRRVSRDDLKLAIEREAERDRGWRDMRVWRVCDDYEIIDENIVARYSLPYFDAPPGSAERWRRYDPLVTEPDLFLKLASLHESPNFPEAALAFSKRYGVLGGDDRQNGGGWTWEYTSLAETQKAARQAWQILRLYEAVLNRDPVAARTILSGQPNQPQHIVAETGLEEALLEEGGEKLLQEFVLDTALLSAIKRVNEGMKALCRVEAEIPWRADLSEDSIFCTDVSKIRSAWRFDNLTGATYLQIYWLMSSGETITRCEHCGRAISSARPRPDGRKRRRDKKFCDDACRQAHHRAKSKT